MLGSYTCSDLLIRDDMLQVKPQLARLLGLEEALVLQYISSWFDRSSQEWDGHRWTAISDFQWMKDFLFMWPEMPYGCIERLLDKGLLYREEFTPLGFGMRFWYRVDYEALEAYRLAKGVRMRFLDDEE